MCAGTAGRKGQAAKSVLTKREEDFTGHALELGGQVVGAATVCVYGCVGEWVSGWAFYVHKYEYTFHIHTHTHTYLNSSVSTP